MLGKEKSRQVAIDLEKAGTGHADLASIDAQESLGFQVFKRICEFMQNIDAEFPAEIVRVEASGLELEDHLANEKLSRLHGERPPER